jgi:hypothetical protein
MIWHIFKKDLKLMWRPASAVAGIQFAFATVQILLGPGADNAVLRQLSQVLLWLWLIAAGILIVTVVHQDAVPSTKQDWLTRPIRRADLLVEKVLFAFLIVQGASVLTDLLQGLAGGFSFWRTLGATAVRAVILFISLTLPALAVGAITETVTEAVVLILIAGFGVFAFTMLAIGLAGGYGHQFDPTDFTGEGWLTNGLRFAIVVLGIGFAMVLQYRTRHTRHTRVILGITLGLALFSQFTPWKPVFAIQKTLSPDPGAADRVELAWRGQSNVSRQEPQPARSQARIYIPLRVTGMPGGTILKADKSEVILTDQQGKRLFAGAGTDLEIRNDASSGEPISFDHAINLPEAVRRSIGTQPVRVNVNYSLTLFKLTSNYSLRAVNDSERLPGWGWCQSKIDENATAVEVSCMQIGEGPTCASVFLEHFPTGKRDPSNNACYPDYAPYRQRAIPDVMARFRMVLPFRDPAGLEKYPVEAALLPESRVVIHAYTAQDHFTRTVSGVLTSLAADASAGEPPAGDAHVAPFALYAAHLFQH